MLRLLLTLTAAAATSHCCYSRCCCCHCNLSLLLCCCCRCNLWLLLCCCCCCRHCCCRVEATLKASGAALVWVTHDPQQHRRVGGQQLVLPAGTLTTIPATPSAVSLVEVQDGASDRTSTAAADGSDEGSQHASVASQEVRIAVQL